MFVRISTTAFKRGARGLKRTRTYLRVFRGGQSEWCQDSQGRTYEEKLAEVGLTTLEERRVRGDMIQVFKILHGYDDVNKNTWFSMAGEINFYRTRLALGLNIATPRADCDIRRNFFSCRVVDKWNNLPDYIKCATSVNNFKNLYDSWRAIVTQSQD